MSKSRQLDHPEQQIQQLNNALTQATLREKATRSQQLLKIKPLESIVLAIQSMGENQDKLPQQPLPAVQASLRAAMEEAREQNCLRGHQGKVSAVAVSRDGQTIVSGSWDGTLRLWND